MKPSSTKYEIKTKLRKGDEVVILGGKSKGETGKIDRIDTKKYRVYIAGKNLGKRHTKPSISNQEGGIIDIPMPIHISKVALIDPKTKKATRVGYKIDGTTKVRIARKSGQAID